MRSDAQRDATAGRVSATRQDAVGIADYYLRYAGRARDLDSPSAAVAKRTLEVRPGTAALRRRVALTAVTRLRDGSLGGPSQGKNTNHCLRQIVQV